MRTYNRIREHGTVESAPASGEERIAAIRSVVETGTYAKIDGLMVDLFSASTIVQIYDALRPELQLRYAAMPAPRMAEVAFTIAAKH